MKLSFLRSDILVHSIFLRVFIQLYKQIPLFFWVVSYYTALFFVFSNLSFILVALVFYLLLYIVLKDLKQATFLMFVASLPFAKGKTFEWILVAKENIPRIGLYDIGYYFPLYPSLVFLIFSLYLYLRTARVADFRRFASPVVLSFAAFLFIGSISTLGSPFANIILLSLGQLALMGCVYILPHALRLTDKTKRYISHILSGFVLFQTSWIVLQVFNHGPLGRYLEATLPLNRMGILSSENSGLMRYNGTFFEPSIMGTFMLMHAFYFFGIVLYDTKIKNIEKILYSVAAVSAGIAVIFTASRGIYFLSVVLGGFFLRKKLYFLLSNIFRTFHYKVAVAGLIAGLAVFVPYITTRLQSSASLFGTSGSGTFRLQLSDYAMRLAGVHPFGVGLNLSPYYFAFGFPLERKITPAHPHNLLMQIVAEMGFPGLIAFLVFVWLLYRQYVIQPSKQSTPYLMASASFLLAAQFYPIFISQPEILSFFFFHAGLMTWTLQRQKHEG